MIEIAQEKQGEMAEHAEMVLKHAGKLMQCIEDMCEEEDGETGMRRGRRMGRRMGRRGSNMYGAAATYRRGDMDDDYDPMSDY